MIGQETDLSPYVSHLTSLPLTLPTSFILPLSRSLNLELCKLLGTFLCEGDADLLLLVVVKVAGVTWSFELGHKGSFNLKDTLKRQSRGWVGASHIHRLCMHTQRHTSAHTHSYLFLVDGNPVSSCEPLVSLYVVDPVLEIPVTFCEIHLRTRTIQVPHI